MEVKCVHLIIEMFKNLLMNTHDVRCKVSPKILGLLPAWKNS